MSIINYMKSVTLKPGRYRCFREDGFGDVGFMFRPQSPTTNRFVGKPRQIQVGKRQFCGNLNTWIVTSQVIEILEVNKEKTFCRFKTLNSIYTVEVV